MKEYSQYSTWVWDCDGVVLNSNKVKTQAFYNAALPYGVEAAQLLVDYHVANGGISRYKKFELFLAEIVSSKIEGPTLNELLKAYASEVYTGMLECEMVEGLLELREKMADTRWLIVSGGDQTELRDVFSQRGILDWFDGGIFGSPDTKDEVIEREIANCNISTPALFIGDSRYDHVASSNAGLDFVFFSQWTEFQQWREYCSTHSLASVRSLEELCAVVT